MNKLCCYALIFLLLLFLVFFADYLKLRSETKQKDIPQKEITVNNSQPQINADPEKEKNLRYLLQKYLKSDLENEKSQDDSVITNRFLPDIKPLNDIVISQKFTELHNGIDLAAASGEIVIAAAAGKIVKSGYDEYFGNLVVIDHLNGYSSFYGHLSEIYVKENYFAEKKMQIGAVGSTGFSTGPHLHYAISENHEFIDPELLWTN